MRWTIRFLTAVFCMSTAAKASTLGDRFPSGLVVMMNSAGRNFQLYDLRRVLEAAVP